MLFRSVGYPQGNIPMSDGFGGALAAPIWHDYMESASGGYCGEFPTPTDPFHGTPFFGHFSVSGGSTTVTGDSGTVTGVGGTPTTDNPGVLAQPPQSSPTANGAGGVSVGGATH